MLEKTKLYYLYLKNKLTVKKPWDTVIIFVLNVLIAIPIFIVVHQNLIQFNWYFHLDRILIFLLLLVIIQFVLQAMRRITLVSVLLYLIGLLYGTIFGGYGFQTVYEDYQSMMYTMADNPYPQDIIIDDYYLFQIRQKSSMLLTMKIQKYATLL